MLALGAGNRETHAPFRRVLEKQGRPPPHLEGGYQRPAVVRTVVENALRKAALPEVRTPLVPVQSLCSTPFYAHSILP